MKQVRITRDTSLEELQKAYNKETNSKRKLRILMLLHSYQGKSANQTSKILFIDKNAVICWIRRFNEFGFDGLDEKARSGRPKKVDHERLQHALNDSPEKFGYQKDFWYPKLVYQYLLEQQNVKVELTYVYKLIRSLGYSLITPSRKSYKSNQKKVTEFKKKLSR